VNIASIFSRFVDILILFVYWLACVVCCDVLHVVQQANAEGLEDGAAVGDIAVFSADMSRRQWIVTHAEKKQLADFENGQLFAFKTASDSLAQI
jgi:hypothetical protein